MGICIYTIAVLLGMTSSQLFIFQAELNWSDAKAKGTKRKAAAAAVTASPQDHAALEAAVDALNIPVRGTFLIDECAQL